MLPFLSELAQFLLRRVHAYSVLQTCSIFMPTGLLPQAELVEAVEVVQELVEWFITTCHFPLFALTVIEAVWSHWCPAMVT